MKTEKKARRAAEAARLSRALIDTAAQLPVALYSAHAALDKAGHKHMMAGGIVVTLHALGGREITKPFMIADGLSPATIEAIRADIIRGMMLQTIYQPAALRAAVEQCRADYLASQQ